MSEHTPGPWELWGDDEAGGLPVLEIGHGVIGEQSCKAICYVQSTLGADDEFFFSDEDNANARLIAAAPETAAERDRLKEQNKAMLEALKAATRWNTENTVRMPTREIWAMIDAAIRVAEPEGTDNG